MTISIPTQASLYSFEQASTNPAIEQYVLDDVTTYQTGDIVAHDHELYQALEDVENRPLTDIYNKLNDMQPKYLQRIHYKGGVTTFHTKITKLFIDEDVTPNNVFTWKYDYDFVLFDRPMISDMDEVLNPDASGNFTETTDPHDYVMFHLVSGGVERTTYTGGTSPASPGTSQGTTTMTFADFSNEYAGHLWLTDVATYDIHSTMGRAYGGGSTQTQIIRDGTQNIVFNTDLSAAGDPRFISVEDFPALSVTDGKNYTTSLVRGWGEYTLKLEEIADTVALTGLIADSVEITFKDASGNVLSGPHIRNIESNRDRRGLMSSHPTTHIFYSPSDTELTTPIEAGGLVVVKLIGALTSLGGITPGVAVDLGFTDLVFSTKFIDFSPTEEVFNVIQYTEGLKVREYTGSCNFWTENFDMHDRLLLSLGTGLIIFNGSDTLNNEIPDSRNRFTATMMVGRLKSMTLSSKKVEDRMAELAQAKFIIREQV